MIFRKDLESPLIYIYIYIFLRENKIRMKTLSVTPYLEKTVYEKTKVGYKGQITYWKGTVNAVTPL